MADRGTIFLDEVGELPPTMQVKLLQVLQDRSFERVGESTPIAVDIRIIAASNQDLQARIQDKTFRSDLFYRLNTFHIHIPPLRERIEDIPLLVQNLSARQAFKLRRAEIRFTSSAMEALGRYPWPGNVRELENVVERLIILRAGTVITGDDITNLLTTTEVGQGNRLFTKDQMEKQHIQRALMQCRGIIGGIEGAAHLLGMKRTTLQYRMKKLGITNYSSWKVERKKGSSRENGELEDPSAFLD
jgi:formate hydrogenlyase transcriptional activator